MPPSQEPKANKFFDPKANLKALIRLIVIIAALLGCVWLIVRYFAGEKAANNVTAAVLHQRIDLLDRVEDLPASSLKALALTLPYSGTLSVDLLVRKGNNINVYLIEPGEIEKVKAKQSFTYLVGFDAEKTKVYRRSGSVRSGSYYLVLIDKSLGVLSQSSSDIQVKVKLEP